MSRGKWTREGMIFSQGRWVEEDQPCFGSYKELTTNINKKSACRGCLYWFSCKKEKYGDE